MPDINRRTFIGNILGSQPHTNAAYDINKDEIFLKYANQTSPLNFKHTRAGLSQYTGVWGERQKIHLIRRLGFGVTPGDLTAIGTMTMSQTVDAYLNNVVPVPAPPVNYYENTYPDPDLIPLGATWINASYGDGTVDYYRTVGVKSWWMNNIINQGQSITEKMILFWHNNFVTQASDVGDARFLFKYLSLLRTHALGNFKTFVKEITKDPQMLLYLNGQYNVKNSPDENYARELQELFTIGKGSNLWNEDDVKEAAKVLTGFRADNTTITTSFLPALHEPGNKVFSAFYNNTVIVGQAGPAGENELDDLLDMIFSKDDYVARFLCRKIYRFFIYYDIDTTIENNIIAGMAQTLISNNWDIKPVLSELFKSDHFYDSFTEYCFIRTPMDYFLGTARTLAIPVPTTLTIEDSYQAYYVMSYWCDLCGMDPCNPPNVAGWPAYYQVPFYHEMWINSDTLPKRMKLTDSLLTNYGAYVSATFQLKCNVIDFVQTLSNPSDPDAIIDDCVKYLLAIGLSTTIKNQFKVLLLDATLLNVSWTNAWNNHINNPGNTIYEGIVRTRLQDMLTKLLRVAEHHLC